MFRSWLPAPPLATDTELSGGGTVKSLMEDGFAQFGPFELNLHTGELRKAGGVVQIERQPARVLSMLVGRSGQLVPRDELCAHVWPEGTHVDFARGLNYCIRQIRATLGDDAKSPAFIETVPRQGYRFIAPIQLKEGVFRPAEAMERVPLTAGYGPRLALLRYGAAAATAALLTAALMGSRPDSPVATQARHDRHHAAGVALAQTAYEIVFGEPFDASQHPRSVKVLRAAHDLVF